MATLSPELQQSIDLIQQKHSDLVQAVRSYSGGSVAESTNALITAEQSVSQIVSTATSLAAELSAMTDVASQVASDSADAVTAKNVAETARDDAVNIAGGDAQPIFDTWVVDVERRNVESATGGACTIERTSNGQPCHMFVLPRTTWEDLLPGQELGTGTHEAFIENGVEKSELLVGMFMAAEINGELVSQPRTTGRRSIDWDQSVSMANAAGLSLMSNWEWSFLAFWCMSNNWQPRGNTDYGRSHSHTHERGVYDDDSVSEEYTLLGSGPNTWNHNNAANGIADLVGNRWEWQWGFKIVDGRIIMAPDNDKSLAESGWVDTGYDLPGDANPWSSLTQSGATQQVQRALIVPNGVADPDGRLYANLDGERFPIRGGTRNDAGLAGLGALSLLIERSYSSTTLGLRLSRLV